MSTTHHDFVVKHGLSLADNTKIKLGNSDDLQLRHNGSDSFITGTVLVSTDLGSIRSRAS